MKGNRVKMRMIKRYIKNMLKVYKKKKYFKCNLMRLIGKLKDLKAKTSPSNNQVLAQRNKLRTSLKN